MTARTVKARANNATGEASVPKTKVNRFHQRLGILTYVQACRLLGEEGGKLIQLGGRAFELQSDRDVFLGGDLLRLRVEDNTAATRLVCILARPWNICWTQRLFSDWRCHPMRSFRWSI
ncbi:hypothetical protein SH139x_002282 [Planctomycetaceae bacterium SH139]